MKKKDEKIGWKNEKYSFSVGVREVPIRVWVGYWIVLN
jgi:hypothetical protein